MKIEHIAIWVNNLEEMPEFYESYFMTVSGDKYFNLNKNISSYFLSFTQGSRLELMHKPVINTRSNNEVIDNGLVHFAISVGVQEKR